MLYVPNACLFEEWTLRIWTGYIFYFVLTYCDNLINEMTVERQAIIYIRTRSGMLRGPISRKTKNNVSFIAE